MMKVVLVDDEQLAIDVLEILLGKIEDIEVVGTFTNPLFLLDELDRLDVDVLFLDMEMGSLHGLEIAEKIMTHYPQIDIVFVTAHPQFAVEAFEVNAIDYLLKPVSSDRLEKALEKLKGKQFVHQQNKEANVLTGKHPFAQTMGTFHLLDHQKNEVKWRTRKAKELFAYLFHHKGKSVSRDHIIDDLWGDIAEDRATTIMHTTVYQLRKVIRSLGYENPVTLTNEQYMLNLEVESDFDQLKEIMQSPKLSQSLVEKAINLYAGDYLEETGYFWALPVQQEIKQTFLSYLESYVLDMESKKDQSRFIGRCLEKMINLEPYNEQYVHLLLNHYGKTNNMSELIAFFERFKKSWIDELGIDIPEDIEEVYKEYMMN